MFHRSVVCAGVFWLATAVVAQAQIEFGFAGPAGFLPPGWRLECESLGFGSGFIDWMQSDLSTLTTQMTNETTFDCAAETPEFSVLGAFDNSGFPIPTLFNVSVDASIRVDGLGAVADQVEVQLLTLPADVDLIFSTETNGQDNRIFNGKISKEFDNVPDIQTDKYPKYRVRFRAFDQDGEVSFSTHQIHFDTLHIANATFGDFNLDGQVSAVDIDLLSSEARAGTNDSTFDIDFNGEVSYTAGPTGSVTSDSDYLIRESLGTEYGDADLDGRVDFTDFLALAGQFGDPGGWAFGDFSGDGNVDFEDFLLLTTHFSRAAVIPEPSGFATAIFGWTCLAAAGRRRRRCVKAN